MDFILDRFGVARGGILIALGFGLHSSVDYCVADGGGTENDECHDRDDQQWR